MLNEARRLIQALGDDVSSAVSVTAASRLNSRIEGRPGLVKISFRSREEKVLVLRNKMKLKHSADYKRVFLRSSKSHAERLIELNARTVLRSLPNGRNFIVDASGRIKPRPEQTGTHHNRGRD